MPIYRAPGCHNRLWFRIVYPIIVNGILFYLGNRIFGWW